MFNPFAPFTPLLLQAFVNAGKRYFVRQAFTRARDHFDEGIKGDYIFTHYSEAGHAQHHLGAISHDPSGYVYNWNNPAHQASLAIAASGPAGYRIYSSVFGEDWQKHLTAPLRQKARQYIDLRLGWKPARGETIGFQLYVHYGEVYAKLTLKAQQVRVKLEEIEQIR